MKDDDVDEVNVRSVFYVKLIYVILRSCFSPSKPMRPPPIAARLQESAVKLGERCMVMNGLGFERK